MFRGKLTTKGSNRVFILFIKQFIKNKIQKLQDEISIKKHF